MGYRDSIVGVGRMILGLLSASAVVCVIVIVIGVVGGVCYRWWCHWCGSIGIIDEVVLLLVGFLL